MKKFFILAVATALFFSCKNSPKEILTYQDAEIDFCSSLTSEDTTAVISLTEEFIELLKNSQLDSAAAKVCTVEQSVLYKASNEYQQQLIDRFTAYPVGDYKLVRYSFSTPGNNDVCYQYNIADTENFTMKLVFNPVKIDGEWYIVLKDGSQSSLDKIEEKRVHPMAPAPRPIVLNKKNI